MLLCHKADLSQDRIPCLNSQLPLLQLFCCVLSVYSSSLARVGNFIIGASGSDKQMLCASSGARAALNIAAEKK